MKLTLEIVSAVEVSAPMNVDRTISTSSNQLGVAGNDDAIAQTITAMMIGATVPMQPPMRAPTRAEKPAAKMVEVPFDALTLAAAKAATAAAAMEISICGAAVIKKCIATATTRAASAATIAGRTIVVLFTGILRLLLCGCFVDW